jgi:ABC-2 type transport system ATP-binding protein
MTISATKRLGAVSMAPTRSSADPVSSLVEAKGVVVRYGPRTVLHGVDLQLVRGEILGLLGPNGAGKSTLIRRLAGLLPSSDGTVDIEGLDPATHKAARARIGYLPEAPPLYPEDTAVRYVTYMAALAALPRGQRRQAAVDALARTGASKLAGRLNGRLSKGQRQRVALAAAIVHEPDVILLDEPADGLDPRQMVSLRTLLRELVPSAAILFSTHLLGEAQAVCDRVVILDQGAVVASRPVQSLGATRLRVVVPGVDEQSLERTLWNVPGVIDVNPGGVCAVRNPAVGQAIAAAVAAEGWMLQELAPVPDDLEVAFLNALAGGAS